MTTNTGEAMDETLASHIRAVEKATNRVKESLVGLEDAIALALKEKRITPKGATQLRARFRGK
jgi:hypothetical protein